MSQYTTGELAKLCNVSVRTVQYYDTRGILIPSALSEGGRRLYSEEDKNKLQIICFLREIDISIDNIKELLGERESEKVILLLLEEQEKRLTAEIQENQERLDKLDGLKQHLKQVEHFSVESIKDAAILLENKKKMRNLYKKMLLFGIPLNILEIASVVLWITKGWWQLFALWLCLDLLLALWIIPYYMRNVAFICPQCHNVFQGRKKEVFFASHTLKTRKLTCPSCGYRGFCVETYNNRNS